MTNLWAVIRREAAYLCRDRRVAAMLLLGPLFLTLLFGSIYGEHKVRHLPTVILDEDNSILSRQVAEAFGQSETFRIIQHVSTYQEVEQLIAEGKAEVAVIVPVQFSRNVVQGRPTEVLTVINGSNMIIANAATRAASEITQTLSAGITVKTLQAAGIVEERAKNIVSAVRFRSRVWYNPTFNYANFLVLGLIGAINQQVLLLAIALAMSREWETGSCAELFGQPLTAGEIVCGKTLPYLAIGLVNFLLTFGLAASVFAVPVNGSGMVLLLLVLVFVLSLLAIGLFASCFCPNQLAATQMTMLLAVPSFLLSGYTWPLSAMPPVVQGIAYCLPLTHFLTALRAVCSRGAGLAVIWPQLWVLAGMAVVFFTLSGWYLHRKPGLGQRPSTAVR